MLRDAFRAVNENLVALAIFIAMDAPISLAFSALNELYLKPEKDQLGERTVGIATTAELIVQVFVAAALCSVVFSRLARNLDRPLWKVHGASDALARFFPMWLFLFFMYSALAQFGNMLHEAGYENSGQGLILLALFLNMMCVPFGAIVMFLGNGHGEDLRAAVVTVLPRILDRFFLALLIAFFQVTTITFTFIDESTVFWMRPFISAIGIYVDFVIFSYIFLACREQRDLEEPRDPYDF